jgi:hypothetical protein
VQHPDHLVLSARQLFEWWMVYNLEPWGETRADYRAWAQACVTAGSDDVRLAWPYVDAELTSEEMLEEMARIEAAILESKKHGHCRENLDCD